MDVLITHIWIDSERGKSLLWIVLERYKGLEAIGRVERVKKPLINKKKKNKVKFERVADFPLPTYRSGIIRMRRR